MTDLTPGAQAMYDQADMEFGQLLDDLVVAYGKLRSTRGARLATSDMAVLLAEEPGILGLDRNGVSAALAYAVRRLAALNHAIEQLAKQIDAQGAGPDTSKLVRKLVTGRG